VPARLEVAQQAATDVARGAGQQDQALRRAGSGRRGTVRRVLFRHAHKLGHLEHSVKINIGQKYLRRKYKKIIYYKYLEYIFAFFRKY
jgi:hypothetical protein